MLVHLQREDGADADGQRVSLRRLSLQGEGLELNLIDKQLHHLGSYCHFKQLPGVERWPVVECEPLICHSRLVVEVQIEEA